jgi:hypothetical protein
LRVDGGEQRQTVLHRRCRGFISGARRRHRKYQTQKAVTHFVKMRTLVKILS